MAVFGGHSDIVKLLIDSGAQVNAKGLNDVTPLHLASGMGRAEIAALLRQGSEGRYTPTRCRRFRPPCGS